MRRVRLTLSLQGMHTVVLHSLAQRTVADRGPCYQDELDPDTEFDKPEGFWREFFLLKPDRATLQRTLGDLSPDDLIALQAQTRQLFARAVACLRQGGGNASLHALEVRWYAADDHVGTAP